MKTHDHNHNTTGYHTAMYPVYQDTSAKLYTNAEIEAIESTIDLLLAEQDAITQLHCSDAICCDEDSMNDLSSYEDVICAAYDR